MSWEDRASSAGSSTFPSSVSRGLIDLVGFLLPSRCLGCDDRLPVDGPEEPVCARCRSRMRQPPWPRCSRCDAPSGTASHVGAPCSGCRDWPAAVTFARSAVVLEAPSDRLVHALKYDGWKETVPVLVDAMTRVRLPRAAKGADVVVVHVPTSRRRRRMRGYDQAELLAREFSGRAGLDLVPALERSRERGTQVALHPAERRSNVRGVFIASEAERVRGRHVVLVDDVLTTGATACEAATVLERVGASGVTVVTFARALPAHRRDEGAKR